MPRIAAVSAFLLTALLVTAIPAKATFDPKLRVLLPAQGRKYFETDVAASVDIASPVEAATLVVRLDGGDITNQFVTVEGRAKATLTSLAPGQHLLEAEATGQVFDPFLFQYVTKTFEASSAFMVAIPTTPNDFIELGIDRLVRRDMLAARDAFDQALAIDHSYNSALLLLSLTRIAILVDPTLPGSDPSLLDSAAEFLDALGFPAQGRVFFDWTALFPMNGAGQVVLPPTSPHGPDVQRFAVQKVLPEIQDVDVDLRRIPKRFVYLFPADRLGEGLSPVEFDYADVLVLRSLLFMAQAMILTGNSYDLDAGAPDVLVRRSNDGTLDIQQDAILANPNFLRLVSTSDLQAIKGLASGGINLMLNALKSIDNERDPQNDDVLTIPFANKPDEINAKKVLVAIRDSLSRETVIPDVTFGPGNPGHPDLSMPVFLGALMAKNGIDIRSQLPLFERRPDGTNIVLSRTFPDATLHGLLPEFTQDEVIFLADQTAPTIDVHSTGFPQDPNMFHITGSIVEEDLAAGLDLANWEVELLLLDPVGNPNVGGLVFDVTDRFPLTRNPDGSLTFDSFVRFVDPIVSKALLHFRANDLNGNFRTVDLLLELLPGVFLGAPSGQPQPIHAGDGLNGHWVQTGTQFTCCPQPNFNDVDSILAGQAGDPGVVAVVDRMIMKELQLIIGTDIPLTGPGAGKLTGFIRITNPGSYDFFTDPNFLGALRLRIGGKTITEGTQDAHRVVYFPQAGFYTFELVHMTNWQTSTIQVRMEPAPQGITPPEVGPFVPLAILYKSLDTDGDGVTDSVEIAAGLNPNDPGDIQGDTDGDGLTGAEELAHGTKANNPDTDADGLNDKEETIPGNDGVVTDPTRSDPDGDTLLDGEETQPGTDGFVTDPFSSDTDGDGRADNVDSLPVPTRVQLTTASPCASGTDCAVTAQLRTRDGAAIAKAGIPFRLDTGNKGNFSNVPVEGTIDSYSGNRLDVRTSAAGRVVVNFKTPFVDTITVTFIDQQNLAIDGQLFWTDFEAGPAGFTQTVGTLWEHGIPTSGPGTAASGVNLWATDLDGNYPPGVTADLQTPSITFPAVPGGANALLRFKNYHDMYPSEGFGRVIVSPNGFEQTVALYSNTSLGVFRSESVVLFFQQQTARTIPITFRFSSNPNTTPRPGWYIDDVEVTLQGRQVATLVFQ